MQNLQHPYVSYCIPCHRLPFRSLHWPSRDQKGILSIHPIIGLRFWLGWWGFPFSFCFSLFVIGLFLLCPSYGTILSIVSRSFPYSASLILSHVPNLCYGAIWKVTPLAGPGLSHPWKWYLKVELSGLGVSEFWGKVSFMGCLSFGGQDPVASVLKQQDARAAEGHNLFP